jgi:hypothetical protein
VSCTDGDAGWAQAGAAVRPAPFTACPVPLRLTGAGKDRGLAAAKDAERPAVDVRVEERSRTAAALGDDARALFGDSPTLPERWRKRRLASEISQLTGAGELR